ncbi:MAG: CoA-binding protein [Deltaproteobacteria bacterium]|nr:CoA-binding protein [Deltaproteobacteria bacterium]
MNPERFSSLWNPNIIAVVGASDRASSWTQEIYSNLTGLGFRGRIVPVNPRRSTIWGLEAYASLKDIPFQVDLAIIAIPAAGAVEASLRQEHPSPTNARKVVGLSRPACPPARRDP